jgi:hypothetical protein
MRDAGLPSRAERSKLANKMAKTVQDRMMFWTEDNFGYFEQTMEMIREGAPVQWVKLYMEAVKMGIVKESNININISRQKDRDDLQALVRSRIPISDKGAYVPYEEVRPISIEAEPLPRKSADEE